MGAGQSKPGEPGAEDPNEPQLPGGGGRPPTRPDPSSETESSTSTTETTTTESTTTTETTTSTTTTTTTITTTPTPTPTPPTTSLSHATLPTSSSVQAQAKPGGKVNLAAIVLPCLFAPFIIAAIAIFVIRRQRKKANARLLEDFKRRSMFGTRGNDLFSTAKHEVQAPPVSGTSSPAPFKPQPPSAYSDAYSAHSPYGAPSAYGTAPGAASPAYPGYTAPPAWGAAPAWQAAAPPAESSAAWSALGVAAPPPAPSPVSPSPVSPYEIDDRRQLRVTNARSVSEQSISSVGHDAPLISTSSGGAKKDDELGNETLKAWMKD